MKYALIESYIKNAWKKEIPKTLFGNNNITNQFGDSLFGGNIFKTDPNIQLFFSNSGHSLFTNRYSKNSDGGLFTNPYSEKKVFKKPLFMCPIFSTNKIMGALEEEDTITLEVDFSQVFNKQDVQLNQFVPSSAYCNSEGYMYITGGKDDQKDIGKIFIRISVNNNNDTEVNIVKMPMMNFSHWNHSQTKILFSLLEDIIQINVNYLILKL